ncbi:non-ribosomal peptide synthetase [Streptomyces sp. NBC_00078]|uniref:non-ribosomal peptide synthetase n=1 Tax=unclassified Streptomyces TaxID=2593676 RepID=UPI002256AA6A|nr:non-ribosomal peptide synthetase [Streptomyces sp. NBC_00078]MCX5420392.1 amino acid adenylation domain-containing protein [Streptomyces sp. NBC_00078]
MSPLLPARIVDQAARTPAAVAVVDGDRSLTYGELVAAADRVADTLRARGLGPEDRVGVLMPRGLDLVVALLGVWRAAAAYVPLDPAHPAERTRWIVADAGVRAVLTDDAHAGVLPADAVPTLLVGAGDELTAAARPSDVARPAPDPANAAYVLYTSGSTGHPKGVVITHEGIAGYVDWRVRTHGLGPGDRVLQRTPVGFDAAGWEIFAPQACGATLVIAPPGAERDPAEIVRAVLDAEVNVLQVVPSILRLLADEPGWSRCHSLRVLTSGGESLHAEYLAAVPATAQVYNTYGPTECTIDVAAHPCDRNVSSGPAPIGRPVTGVRLLVLDPGGEPCPVGVPGELYVGGVAQARGYEGRPDLTAQRFVPDPHGPAGGRLYRTGDRVRWREDGNLEYLGRLDQQVKVGGVRIEPGEVETAIAAHPQVTAAVVGTAAGSDGAARLTAYVVGDVAPAALRSFLRERLPAPMIPSVLTSVDSFPLLSNGKIDRSALSSMESVLASRPAYLAPRTDAELAVAEVWQELLGVEKVGADDDFFQLGGYSLLLTRLAGRLTRATGRDVGLQDLYTHTTVADQALLVAPRADGSGREEPPPIVRVARDGRLPLSFGQRRMWFLDQLRPGSGEYTVPLFVRLHGRADPGQVRAALGRLAERHEILRTRYAQEDGEPLQIIDPSTPVELRTSESSNPVGEVSAEIARGFDLAAGPVWRALLVRSADGRGNDLLLLTLHHIACDGWSAVILERDFHALLAGDEPAPPPVQYADYAHWQRQWHTDARTDRGVAAWRDTLADLEPLVLPADRPRPPVRDEAGALVTFDVPAETAEELVRIGRRCGATPFAVLLTGLTALLARRTGQWDVAVGTPTAGRLHPETQGTVGFFLNSLIVRPRLRPEEDFERSVRRVDEARRFALAHQDVPFDRLVDAYAGERDLSRTPLYQVAFDLHDQELTGGMSGSDDLAAMREAWRVAKTDLTVFARRRPEGSYAFGFEYATALFDRDTVEALAGQFRLLLERLAARPELPLREVDLLSQAEHTRFDAWNRTEAAFGPETALALFERQAAKTPDAPAVTYSGTAMSYRELDVKANQFAGLLKDLGVCRGDAVGVLVGRGLDLHAVLLGVWKAGAAYVPVDPLFPAQRIGHMLADARARVLVSESCYRTLLPEAFDGELVMVDLHRERVENRPGDPVGPPVTPQDTAYVIYTSGSTGRPKGVRVAHRGLANHLQWAVRDLASQGTTGAPVFSSTAFDLVVPNLYAPLLAGQPVHMAPRDLPVAELGRVLAETGPFSFIKLTPGHLELLAHQLGDAAAASLASVIVVAGEALPARQAEHWRRLLGDGRLINEYGPTEGSVGSTIHPVAGEPEQRIVPLGRALPGVTVHVLDEALNRVPAGSPGELCVGGAGVADGYTGDPARTAARFVPDPYGAPGERLYRTGDLAKFGPTGEVMFLGRMDGQLKVRGYRVETGEIEAVLREHPGVRDAVVIAAATGSGTPQDPEPGDVRLHAYYVPVGAEVPNSELTAHVVRRLPDYMVPAAYAAVELIPLNRNGKVDRSALPRIRVDDTALAHGDTPTGPAQIRVATIFSALLGADPGAHTNFFAAGGNSLAAVRLIARIQDEFDVDLPVRTVFAGPTVAELAQAVEDAILAEIDNMSDAQLAAAHQEQLEQQ